MMTVDELSGILFSVVTIKREKLSVVGIDDRRKVNKDEIVRSSRQVAGGCFDMSDKRGVIFKSYSSYKLIALNTLHEVVPTWYSFHS